MSDVYYGDYGLSEASAIFNRAKRSAATQAAMFRGQTRGRRRVGDIQRQYREGFDPLVSSFGQRGLLGPNVQSGITREGLSRYAESLQRDLGTENENMQDEMNRLAIEGASSQEELENYLGQLRLQKAQDVMRAATEIKNLASY